MGFTGVEILPLLGRVAGAAQQAVSDLDRTGHVQPFTVQLLKGALSSYRSAIGLEEGKPATPCYLLDGAPIVLKEFFRDNQEGLSAEQVEAILLLRPGQEMRLGGGAAPVFTVRRAS